jgi:hypothetical protein
MSTWSQNNNCPINEVEKEWIEKSLVWFEKAYGADFIIDIEQLTPTKNNFNIENISSEKDLKSLINKVTSIINFDNNKLNVTLVIDDVVRFYEEFSTINYYYEKDYVQKPLRNKITGKYELLLYSHNFSDILNLISDIAFQVSNIKLFHESSYNNPYFSSVAETVFGFGIFQANSIIAYNQWQGQGLYRWKVARRGYLLQQEIAYLLANLIVINGGKKPEWTQYLCRDVSNYLNQSIEFIKINKKENLFLNADIRTEIKDEDILIRRSFYKEGQIYSFYHLKGNMMHGLCTFFHKNGKIWSQRIYQENCPWTVLSNYNSEGKPVEKGNLENGSGQLFVYNEDGSLNVIETYENGVAISKDIK